MSSSSLITDNPETAYEWLMQGKLIAYPTESVWGLGCNAFDEQAVNALLTLKNRPMDKGLIVLTSTEFFVQDFLKNLPQTTQNNIIASWDYADNNKQATTWLLPIPENIVIPKHIRGEHTNLAIRVINQAKASMLCDLLAINENANRFGFLVSTSCNLNGEPPATDFETAYRYFGDKVCYLQGETMAYDKPSQIRCAVSGEIIRI